MLDRNDTINGVACLPSIAIIADVRRGRGGSQLGRLPPPSGSSRVARSVTAQKQNAMPRESTHTTDGSPRRQTAKSTKIASWHCATSQTMSGHATVAKPYAGRCRSDPNGFLSWRPAARRRRGNVEEKGYSFDFCASPAPARIDPDVRSWTSLGQERGAWRV